MSRVSKGKVKYLWTLYAVWDIIELRKSTIWFFEPSPEFKATVNKWLLRMEDLDGRTWLRHRLDDLKDRNPDYYRRYLENDFKPEKKSFGPTVRKMANKGYYDGCRKINNELDIETVISVSTLENPVHLTIMRDKPRLAGVPGKVIAYDIEADVYRVPCGGFNHQHSASGRIYAKGSFDRIKDIDIADTYPKTLEVVDEANLDRLLGEIAARGA